MSPFSRYQIRQGLLFRCPHKHLLLQSSIKLRPSTNLERRKMGWSCFHNFILGSYHGKQLNYKNKQPCYVFSQACFTNFAMIFLRISPLNLMVSLVLSPTNSISSIIPFPKSLCSTRSPMLYSFLGILINQPDTAILQKYIFIPQVCKPPSKKLQNQGFINKGCNPDVNHTQGHSTPR